MTTTLSIVLKTYERHGEVHSNCIPSISAAFMPELVKELQRHDPALGDSPSFETERNSIAAGQDIPITDLEGANLVLCIIVPGNQKLEACKDEIEATLSRKLSGVLHPIPGIHVVLNT